MKNNKMIRRMIALLVGVILISSLMIPAVSASDESTYDLSGATRFVFSDDGIEVTEGDYSGYKIDGTSLSIKDGGVYVVSGACANGTIVVKKNVTGVTLVLNGLTLSASATAPITCNKGSEVSIVAASGTVNNLADDKYNNDDTYTDETLYPDIENAVIKCKDGSNVTICGTGTINITANGKNGIKGGFDLYEEDEEGNATSTLLSTSSLTIKEVTLNITANVNDGLKSDKELNILSGNITVSAVDDGIKCDYVMNIGAEGTGGPTVNVKKATEGIEAATLNVYSGNITVNATDDGINAANSDLTNYSFSYNQYDGYVYVNVTNGDGIDSNGTIDLIGGTLEVYTPSQGDGDPLDAERGTYFKGATVLAVGHLGMAQSYSATTPYVTFGSTGGMGGFGGFGGRGSQTNLVTAGSTIQITDASGNVLYSAKAVRNASYILFASSELTTGSSYTLKSGSTTSATSTAEAASNGGMGGQMPAAAASTPFTDVKDGKWYTEAIKYVYENKLMNGMTDTTFEPDTSMSRAMLVTVLWRAEGSPAPAGATPFTDLKAKWYKDAVAWAYENGIVNGMTATTFGPDVSISREQIAAIMYRFTEYKGGDVSARADLSGFPDGSKTHSYAKDAMSWAVAESLISGVKTGDVNLLDPCGNATRAQVATILMRYLEE